MSARFIYETIEDADPSSGVKWPDESDYERDVHHEVILSLIDLKNILYVAMGKEACQLQRS